MQYYVSSSKESGLNMSASDCESRSALTFRTVYQSSNSYKARQWWQGNRTFSRQFGCSINVFVRQWCSHDYTTGTVTGPPTSSVHTVGGGLEIPCECLLHEGEERSLICKWLAATITRQEQRNDKEIISELSNYRLFTFYLPMLLHTYK